ncbi:MAG: class I SAM-dependent methyltransferase [Peptococcaceae bacterium]
MLSTAQLRQTLLKIKGKKFNINDLAFSYDQIAKEYLEKFYDPFRENYQEIYNLLGSLNKKKLLDLGCGPGWFGQMILTKSSPALYHGIDLSTGMLQEARKLLKDFTNTKMEHHNFLEKLSQLPEDSYDIIICTWSIDFNEIENLLKKIFRVLKPGGKLVMLCDTANSCCEVNDIIQKLLVTKIKEIDYVLPQKYFPANSHALTELFNDTGFRQSVIWNKSTDFVFASPLDVYKWTKYSGLLVLWDQILDLRNDPSKDFIKLLQPAIPGKYVITKKYLGAITTK